MMLGSVAQEVVVEDILARIKYRIDIWHEGKTQDELKDLYKEIEKDILVPVSAGWY